MNALLKKKKLNLATFIAMKELNVSSSKKIIKV